MNVHLLKGKLLYLCTMCDLKTPESFIKVLVDCNSIYCVALLTSFLMLHQKIKNTEG